MDTDDTEDDFHDLFDQLDADSPIPISINTDVHNALPLASDLQPSDFRRIDDINKTPVVQVEPPVVEQPVVDIRQQFQHMDVVVDEILNGVRADRQEVQDTIILLRSQVDLAINNNANPPRMYIEGLVKALEVKTTINMTAVKAMEAKSKLIAATKAGLVINNSNSAQSSVTQGVDQTLVSILSQPIEPGDDI